MLNVDLSRVMNAYRGQEDKLRKRVQLSNDLLELIAYEQLTREKRQLMADQQAKSMPPGGLPTLRDQKEEEAFELTKQELAQQVGKTLQQQDAARRQAMGRGVAAAPGAQNVMPPQAMAAGGIVAFNGQDRSDVQAYPIEERRKPIFIPQGRSMRRLLERAAERQAELEQEQREAAPEAAFGVGARPPAPPAPEQDMGAAPRARELTVPYEGPDERFASPIPAPSVRDAGLAPSAQTAPPKPAAAPGAATGIEAALRAAVPSNDMQQRLAGQVASTLISARQNRETPQFAELAKIRQELQKYGEEFPKEAKEARAAREAEQQKLERYYAQMMDPEQNRMKNLIAFLAGGAGRRGIGSVLGGAAEAGSRAQAQQQAFGLQALKDMQAGRETMRARELEEGRAAYQARGKGLELGTKIAELSAKLATELGIADKKIDTELAVAMLGAAQRHAGDMERIKAELAAKAQELKVRLSEGELNRLTQIAVAQIGSEARGQAANAEQINTLIRERARIQNSINDNRRQAIEKTPGLQQALDLDPKQRSAAQQRMINSFEATLAPEKEELNNIDARIRELRGGQAATPSPTRAGSAASQGVTVTGAAAPR